MTIACPDCGTLQDLPRLERGATALCRTCHKWLERTRGRSVAAALGCALTTFVLLIPANILPLMSVSILGLSRQSQIGSAVVSFWNDQWVLLAALVALLAVALPLVRFGLLSLVLSLIHLRRRPPWLGRAFRWSEELDQWAMPDVFMIGFAVGYSRVSTNLTVSIGVGGLCLIGAALLCMLSRASLDRRSIWRAIAPDRTPPTPDEPVISCVACAIVLPASAQGHACPRCGMTVLARKPEAILRTSALLIAGFAFYLPANLYPMSIAMQLGEREPHRIVDGIRELFHLGLWPLGCIIFCTSIAIPLLKILGLGWMLLSILRRSGKRLVLKTRAHRFIDEIGRWSTMDVFTIAVFAPLMQFGALASAHAAAGATAFLLVVVLTMMASRVFDPRILWDAGLGSATREVRHD